MAAKKQTDAAFTQNPSDGRRQTITLVGESRTVKFEEASKKLPATVTAGAIAVKRYNFQLFAVICKHL